VWFGSVPISSLLTDNWCLTLTGTGGGGGSGGRGGLYRSGTVIMRRCWRPAYREKSRRVYRLMHARTVGRYVLFVQVEELNAPSHVI